LPGPFDAGQATQPQTQHERRHCQHYTEYAYAELHGQHA